MRISIFFLFFSCLPKSKIFWSCDAYKIYFSLSHSSREPSQIHCIFNHAIQCRGSQTVDNHAPCTKCNQYNWYFSFPEGSSFDCCKKEVTSMASSIPIVKNFLSYQHIQLQIHAQRDFWYTYLFEAGREVAAGRGQSFHGCFRASMNGKEQTGKGKPSKK